MASKGTEFTSEAKSEVNAQVASAAKCPVDHGAIAASPVSAHSGPVQADAVLGCAQGVGFRHVSSYRLASGPGSSQY